MARPTPATERAGGTTSRERTLAHFHPPARSYDGSASGGASSSTPGSHTLASPRTCTVSSPPPSPPPPPPPPFSDATVVAQVTAAPLPLPPGRRRWRTEVTATLAVTTIPAGTGFRKARSWSRYTHPGTRVPKMAEKREAASMPWTMGGGDWDGGGASLSSSSSPPLLLRGQVDGIGIADQAPERAQVGGGEPPGGLGVLPGPDASPAPGDGPDDRGGGEPGGGGGGGGGGGRGRGRGGGEGGEGGGGKGGGRGPPARRADGAEAEAEAEAEGRAEHGAPVGRGGGGGWPRREGISNWRE